MLTARFDPQCAPLGKPKRKVVEEPPIQVPKEVPAAPAKPQRKKEPAHA